jgi:disulfide bond formation protein DsbB
MNLPLQAAHLGAFAMSTSPPSQETLPPDLKSLWTRCALFVAVVGVLGSLHLSLAMDLKACPLCFYQRAFMMAAAGILAFGTFLPGMPTAALTVLALPSATAGAAMAAFHSYRVWAGAMECPKGITDVFVAPEESLAIFGLLTALLLGELFHRKTYVMQGIGAVLLGIIFCTTSVRAVHDAPISPTGTLDGCRKLTSEKK